MSSDKAVQVLHGIQIVSCAALLGYMAAEYAWPYLKRKFWPNSELQRRLQLTKSISLSRHEEELAYNALHPSCIQETLADVGGHEDLIEQMLQITQLLLSSPHTRKSRLLCPPSGVLLYGPPGCGKTMLARALTKQSGIRFLALPLDVLLDKWVGETEKYIAALFSLARKISPVIIFIDEIDSITRKRGAAGGMGGDWSASMKSQLLSLWDGVGGQGIVILGATNRPQDIDEAFLRRMPVQLKIGLPGVRERERILEIFLDDLGVQLSDEELVELARECNGMSGSDLKEFMRRAALKASFSNQSITSSSIKQEIDILIGEKYYCRVYN